MVSIHSPEIEQRIGSEATRSSVRPWPLRLQALMHLPRLADVRGRVVADEAATEIRRLATLLPPSHLWCGPLANASTSVASLRFGSVAEADARRILEHFHYLRSHREDSRYFGLYASESPDPLALASTSCFDVPSLSPLVSGACDTGDARILSRVFAFEVAPKNVISYLLAHVARAERNGGARMLLTYVNPNLGFTGASYRAAGWSLLGREEGTTYRYVDGRYVTDRRLRKRFGTCRDDLLRTKLGSRFQRSRMPLKPLLVFGRYLTA